MPRIDRTSRALLDAVEIWTYVARDNEAAADELIDKIEGRLSSISRMPLSSEEVSYIGPGVRRSSVGNYVVYYRPVQDGIQVLRILHGARPPEDLV